MRLRLRLRLRLCIITLASVLQAASPGFQASQDGAPASGSPKVVEGEVVKPPPS